MEKVFRALAEKNRLRIALILKTGPLNVSEIVFVLGLSQSNVSHHLKLLLNAGVVRRSGKANWAFYSSNMGYPLVEEIVNSAFLHRDCLEGFQEDMNRLALCHELRRDASREFFDSVEEDDWKTIRDQLPRPDEYRDYISEVLHSAEMVLEVGTGSGTMIPFLLQNTGRVLAVDNSREMLNRALKLVSRRKLGGRVELRLGDAEHLPAGDSMVDAVFMHMLLHHAGNPAQAVREAARVLRPGGILLLVDLVEHTNSEFKREQGDLWPGFCIGQIKGFMKQSKLNVESERTFNNGKVLAVAGRKGDISWTTR